MTSKFSIYNRELLQRISSGEAVVGIDFGNLIVRELAAFRLAAMDSEPDRNPVLAYADSYRDMAKQGVESVPIWSVITDIERNIAPLYRHAQPAPVVPVVPVENHIGSKNALDAIVSFIKGKSNPTVKCYEEVSEQLFKDNCHGIHSHVIEYILKLGEELEDLRAEQAEMQPAPAEVKESDELYDVIDDDDNVLLSAVSYNEAQTESDGYNGENLYIVRHEDQPALVVPEEMTPEMMRSVQLNSELGAYAASNLSGAYDLFAEFWKVACRAAMLAAAPQEVRGE